MCASVEITFQQSARYSRWKRRTSHRRKKTKKKVGMANEIGKSQRQIDSTEDGRRFVPAFIHSFHSFVLNVKRKKCRKFVFVFCLRPFRCLLLLHEIIITASRISHIHRCRHTVHTARQSWNPLRSLFCNETLRRQTIVSSEFETSAELFHFDYKSHFSVILGIMLLQSPPPLQRLQPNDDSNERNIKFMTLYNNDSWHD